MGGTCSQYGEKRGVYRDLVGHLRERATWKTQAQMGG